jgi:hypothetical protein
MRLISYEKEAYRRMKSVRLPRHLQ